jgi:hypothetical protein
VAELGGKGNVRNVVSALEISLTQFGIPDDGANPWYYPSIAEYSTLLETHGLEVREADLFERPTKLEAGERGLATWVTMFGGSFLDRLQLEQIAAVGVSSRERGRKLELRPNTRGRPGGRPLLPSGVAAQFVAGATFGTA